MFGMGIGELLLVFVIGLLVFGPERLPQVARNIGKTMRDLQRTTNDIKYSIEKGVNLPDIQQTLDLQTGIKRSVQDIVLPHAEVERRRRAKIRQLKEKTEAESASDKADVEEPSGVYSEEAGRLSTQTGDAGPSEIQRGKHRYDE